jgi:hypothetical protein
MLTTAATASFRFTPHAKVQRAVTTATDIVCPISLYVAADFRRRYGGRTLRRDEPWLNKVSAALVESGLESVSARFDWPCAGAIRKIGRHRTPQSMRARERS